MRAGISKSETRPARSTNTSGNSPAGKVLRRRPATLTKLATTRQSDAMSKDLKRTGFRFVGSTICHAFTQAVGMVDEHQRNCWVADRVGYS
jgi:3-methyladenine DNA glycosylase Tag